MHRVTIRQTIIDRLIARRGRVHWFERLDAKKTESLAPGRQKVWAGLETAPQDLTLAKNRYSVFSPGASPSPTTSIAPRWRPSSSSSAT